MRSKALEEPVDAPGAAPGSGHVEEDEAVEDGGVADIEGRVEVLRRVNHPVGDGHIARENEGNEPREYSEKEEAAAKNFDNALPPQERQELRVTVRWRCGKSEELLRPVFDEDEGRDNPKKAEQVRRQPVA